MTDHPNELELLRRNVVTLRHELERIRASAVCGPENYDIHCECYSCRFVRACSTIDELHRKRADVMLELIRDVKIARGSFPKNEDVIKTRCFLDIAEAAAAKFDKAVEPEVNFPP